MSTSTAKGRPSRSTASSLAKTWMIFTSRTTQMRRMPVRAPGRPAWASCTAQRNAETMGVMPMPPATSSTLGASRTSKAEPYGPSMFMTTPRQPSGARFAKSCSLAVKVPSPMFFTWRFASASSGEALREKGCHSCCETWGKFTTTYMPEECIRACPGQRKATFVIFSEPASCGTSSVTRTASRAPEKRRSRSKHQSSAPGRTKGQAFVACQSSAGTRTATK
mmetsp:Transcript_93305/g.301627  ORF Transcript_93305/g.301627 Transcript_93305/m.301627 type:complete len:222 (+) Transcript_93305:208-873(+)